MGCWLAPECGIESSRGEELPGEYTTARLDTQSAFPYDEGPSEVQDADPERMGKNL
jgi:hypothetical protein